MLHKGSVGQLIILGVFSSSPGVHIYKYCILLRKTEIQGKGVEYILTRLTRQKGAAGQMLTLPDEGGREGVRNADQG